MFHVSAYCSTLLESRAVPEFPGHQTAGYAASRPSVKTWWCMNCLLVVLLGQARVAVMVHACVGCRISEGRPNLSITHAPVHIWVDKYGGEGGSLPISNKAHCLTKIMY